jgi:hypothetical protein
VFAVREAKEIPNALHDASAKRREAITDERRRAITTRIRWVAQHVRTLARYTTDDRIGAK